MLPPQPCWTETSAPVGQQPLVTGVHLGDTLVWINGSWVSMPSSMSSPCGLRKFYGQLVPAHITTPRDLVASGSALEKNLSYFNPVQNTLFVFDIVTKMWDTYKSCTGDLFIDLGTNNSYALPTPVTVVHYPPTAVPVPTGPTGAAPQAAPTPHPDTVFGIVVPANILTAADLGNVLSLQPLHTGLGYYNPDSDTLFQYDKDTSSWNTVQAVKGSEFIDVNSGDVYARAA